MTNLQQRVKADNVIGVPCIVHVKCDLFFWFVLDLGARTVLRICDQNRGLLVIIIASPVSTFSASLQTSTFQTHGQEAEDGIFSVTSLLHTALSGTDSLGRFQHVTCRIVAPYQESCSRVVPAPTASYTEACRCGRYTQASLTVHNS